jgi:hypothetical protein
VYFLFEQPVREWIATIAAAIAQCIEQHACQREEPAIAVALQEDVL